MSYRLCWLIASGNPLASSQQSSDDGLRNCPKHVELYSKNKFEKFVHLVGFTTRIHCQCSGRFNLGAQAKQWIARKWNWEVVSRKWRTPKGFCIKITLHFENYPSSGFSTHTTFRSLKLDSFSGWKDREEDVSQWHSPVTVCLTDSTY